MFNKKLKKRIASLEDYLGLVYVPTNEGWVSDEHVIATEFGVMGKVKTLLKDKTTD